MYSILKTVVHNNKYSFTQKNSDNDSIKFKAHNLWKN